MFIVIPGVDCGDPTPLLGPYQEIVIDKAVMSFNLTAVLNVKCQGTKFWSDYSNMRTMTCMPDGNWTRIDLAFCGITFYFPEILGFQIGSTSESYSVFKFEIDDC